MTPPPISIDIVQFFSFRGNHLERNEDSDQIINVNMSLGTNPVKVILAFGNNFTVFEHTCVYGSALFLQNFTIFVSIFL